MLSRPRTTEPSAPLLHPSVLQSTYAAIRKGVIAASGIAIQCRRIEVILDLYEEVESETCGGERVRPVLGQAAHFVALAAADACDGGAHESAKSTGHEGETGVRGVREVGEDGHSISRTRSAAPMVASPAPPSRPMIFATYAWVSGYGGTQPHAATAPSPAL